MYALIENNVCVEYPYTVEKFRQTHTNVSVPHTATDDQLKEVGIFKVKNATIPNIASNQELIEGTPEWDGSDWIQVWTIVTLTPEQYDIKRQAQWDVIRQQRNELLSESDWTQIPDSTADKLAWADYRQHLRDITLQSDPFNVIWPLKPH